MISMVRFLALVLLAGISLPVSAARAQSSNPDLSAVQTVYVLPMTAGMDQFVAHQIARNALYNVTTDPRHADAFLREGLAVGVLRASVPPCEESSCRSW